MWYDNDQSVKIRDEGKNKRKYLHAPTHCHGAAPTEMSSLIYVKIQHRK
jgi:hypothetical protein